MVDANVRDQLFISYSHRDEQWLDDFRIMLAPVQKSGCLELWCDKDIEPGESWNEKIEKAISRAKVALLLVSDTFLASDFIRNSELPIILRYHTERGLRIYWVLLEPCLIEQTPLCQMQATHPIKTSLSEIND
ncbi:MAG: toll/interleukin-1 receptor domain-containing protein, partial [Rhodoplanes sp.]